MVRWLLAGAILAGTGGAARADDPIQADWRKVATANDRARLRSWRDAWMSALAEARAAGDAAAISRQGALFEVDRALAQPRPPAGDYRCRVFKLGGKRPAAPDFTAYPAFACRIDDEGEVASFHKASGSQRPVGLMFDDRSGRGVFLGTMMLGDETRPIDYGRDAARDMAGYVERVGEKRWRIVLPWPKFESTLDVIELVPAD